MLYDSKINALLEEALESSRSIEEVCAEYPEHVNEVRSRVQQIRQVEAQVELLFPTSVRNPRVAVAAMPPLSPELPSIPGYEMLSVLGRGGMGVVYHARHVRLNRSVALKMLLAGSYASQTELMRFVREAESVAGLRHANIVQVYDVGEVEGRPYYTMEFIEGGSLGQKVAAAPLSIHDAAETLVTLARAVQSAHDGGIVHRDLKPANVLLTADGTPKISDFGLARRVDVEEGLTVTGARIGTPSYMAPEQVSGGPIGPGVDIFALGALLYEMLTGKPPFRGESISDTERRLISEDPTPPSRVNPKVPRDLETICLKCLQKSPPDRYESATALAEDLQRFLRYEPIRARPATPGERALRWVRRNPAWSALIVAALALGSLVAIDTTQELTLAAQRRAEKARLTERLDSGLALEQQGRYAEARVLLARLGDGGHADLRRKIDRAVANLDLIESLDSITLSRVSIADGGSNVRSNKADADRKYAEIYSKAGLGCDRDDPGKVAFRIGGSTIKSALVAALDDWAVCTTDPGRRNWVLKVCRFADPDPSGWRDEVRDPKFWNDRDKLVSLAASRPDATPSLQLLRSLADRMDDAGIDTVPFRTELQQAHADSFVANVSLADALRERDPAEAVRYYQAAVAIRPQSALAHNNLGAALASLERNDEAIEHYQLALALDTELAVVHYNLGQAYRDGGDAQRAIQAFRRAVEIDSEYTGAAKALEDAVRSSPTQSETSTPRSRMPQAETGER